MYRKIPGIAPPGPVLKTLVIEIHSFLYYIDGANEQKCYDLKTRIGFGR
ncbi:PF05960 family protein [Leptospira santarosai]|uniref:PF05960 family protein n=1 Tax=Leptospira santarosai TaxID=28183 RepID=A0A2P1QYL2_9LEPT|nr:PF05960 family protein [Leptospira santarosai]